jgi:hypothetical protein
MTINDFMYFSMEQMIEMMSSSASGIGGAVQLKDSDNDENDEDGDGAPDTVINAYGLIFPILCHEVIKGLEESKGRYGDPEDAEVRQIVQQKTDTLPMESWTLRLGPEIVEKVAKQNKEEYEGFEDVSPKDDGDDDGLDFLAGLGISRPK